ncbi:MAG: hypothetical protein J6X99_00905 [Bacteroidales bacterium]|nr:hypothetical protein [Bacteroidales bacterium]
MKKIILILLGSAVTLAAYAQSWQEALYFSENTYGGTARSVGMGNALTAVGGDPGSLTFNPAGSAVAAYSQLMITPGFTLSSVNASGVVLPGNNAAIGLGDNVNTLYGRMKLPNVGFVFNINTGSRTGLKRMSIGFVANQTADYTSRINSSGVNGDNSYAASRATSAEGFTEKVLGTEDWWYDGADASRKPYWEDMVGYRSGMFNGVPDSRNVYQAVTESRDESGNMWISGPLFQKYGQQTTGGKHDMILNFGMDFGDKFYLGANLGITTMRYALSEYWYEAPENPSDFPEIEYTDGTHGRFQELTMKRNYRLNGTGVYFKAGFLWRPVAGLRIGAAFQTPTAMKFTARQAYAGETVITGKSIAASTSPEDSWTYGMNNPYRVNAGLAYSFGSFAVLSADYEFVDYQSVRYKSPDLDFNLPTYLSDANLDIKDVLGSSHLVRVGLEVKPASFLSVRAGYNFTSCPQKKWLTENWETQPLTSAEKSALAKHAFSLGLGTTFGSFYLDAAARVRLMPKEYIVAYNYYTYDDTKADGYLNKFVDTGVITPEIEVKSTLVDILLTFGWRF